MAVVRKAAEYREKEDITEFLGNPLIAALPASVSQGELLKLLLKIPPYRKEDRRADTPIRLDLLSRIGTVHIPYAHDVFIARSLSRCINWGYVARNPIPFDVTSRVVARYRGEVPGELENYLKGAVFPVYGFSVLGISGVGKSCSVLNALRFYPQVIDHVEYNGVPFHCAQLVWLKVDCPSDGSPKGLCTAILQQIDAVLGTHYRNGVTSRISRDVLTTKVSQCLCSHHLGVLVIDDIQNLCGNKKDATLDMLSFLVYLMETLAIPVVMVGTPKVLPLFQQEFQLAKRATGDGTVRMNLLARDSREWERFITGIWNNQFTGCEVKLTAEMANVFYSESVGNPFLCSLIYKLVQDDAITSGAESFGVQDVVSVARDKLCITNTMRANMLKGTDEEMKRYEYLWAAASAPFPDNLETDPQVGRTPKTSKEEQLISAVSVELARRFGMGISQATRLAQEAVAAKGLADQSEVLGFAIALYEAAFPDKQHESPFGEGGQHDGSGEGGG